MYNALLAIHCAWYAHQQLMIHALHASLMLKCIPQIQPHVIVNKDIPMTVILECA